MTQFIYYTIITFACIIERLSLYLGFTVTGYYHLNYGLWSKALCKLSSLSDLKDLPHVLHTNDWAILIRALVISPLSGVGPMLDADILLVWSTIQFIGYKRRRNFR